MTRIPRQAQASRHTARREANTGLDNPFRNNLRRARIEAGRLVPTFNTSPLGVPTFIFGGAGLGRTEGDIHSGGGCPEP